MLEKAEAGRRIGSLQEEMARQGIDAALIHHPVDVFYFAGTRQTATLFVPAQGAPELWVRRSLVRAREESAHKVRPFPSARELADLVPAGTKRVGLCLDVLTVQQYNVYSRFLPGREFLDISATVRELRSVKSAFELTRMRESAASICSVYRQVPEFLREGMRELDLSAEFEYRLRKAGCEGVVRLRSAGQELLMGVAVTGTNAEIPGFFDGPVTGRGLSSAAPYGASFGPVLKNSPVMLDFSGVFRGYIVDMTRIYAIGNLGEELTRAHATAVAIHDHVAANLKPGAVCEDLFLTAAAMAEASGLGKFFMGPPGANARFVGHGVGLELDEWPVLAQGFKTQLKAGQTIAVEPKFVLPGLGVVGTENTLVVTDSGGENLTPLPDGICYV